MGGLGVPWWLLALLAVPLIYWLHRWRAPVATVPVNALFLWDAAAVPAPGGNSPTPPEAAWWRRALIAGLLAIALAAPWTPARDSALTIWVDDSTSMATIENGNSRLAAALDDLATALDESSFTTITMRSLTNPARAYEQPGAGLTTDAWPVDRLARLSPPALLSSDSAHWLVTDGATENIAEWAAPAGISRVFQAGTATENVAITRLAARRAPDDSRAVEVLLSIGNGGQASASREITLVAADANDRIERANISAGQSQTLVVRVPSAPSVIAALSSDDALILDDKLTLDTATLMPVPTAVDPSCPSALKNALRTHPGLSMSTSVDGDGLRVTCTDSIDTRATTPMLWFRPGPTSRLDDKPLWLPDARPLQTIGLDRAWLSQTGAASASAHGRPLLVAGGRNLVTDQPENRRVDVWLDMANESFARQPEYAAFVAGLIDTALERRVLDPIVAVAIAESDAAIAPRSIELPAGDVAIARIKKQSWSDWLIAIAFIVLLVDMLLLVDAQQQAKRA